MCFCKVCNSNKIDIITVKEMQFGMLDEFEYLHCLECGSLIIKDIPNNLSKYYPVNYYSFKEEQLIDNSFILKKWLRGKYWQYVISPKSKNLAGYIINLLKKPRKDTLFHIIGKTNINLKSRIIDIGCGSGSLLKKLHQFGYSNVLGLDPNINNDIYYEGEKLVIKAKIEDYVKGQEDLYDLIMLHHSFEHIPNPEEVLESIKKLSHKDTVYLIRIPLANSYAFKKYKENWAQLDAPRHLFLYSEKGIRMILEKHNFEILDIIYDSEEFQFWCSEQYLQNISLQHDERSYVVNKSKSLFSEQDILNFRDKATKLNKEKKGDQAAFIFKLNIPESKV